MRPTNTARYRYLANSPLVGQIGFANNGATRMTTTKQYDLLNRLTAIQSSAGVSPVSSFNYSYNSANQRTQATNVDNSHWVYQYDNLGQVISGKKYWSDGTPVAGQQFTCNFDDIGNRKSAASGGDATGANLRSANYTANNLNQYITRDVPGYATVLGSANPNATITVNLQRAVRQGSYFWDELSVGNGSSSLYLSLTNLAVLNNGTNADIIATNVGNIFLPQTPETFGYDADGNMTNSGRWTIIWDAENRALSFASLSSAPTASKQRVDCAYDYQGRRIQKIVSTNNGSAWIPVSTNLYVYDGWNLIAILNPQSSILQSFTWGTDLSGSPQGAGGVGGLLSTTVYSGANAGTYFYNFDGNGNVAALVNATNGTMAAQYEYGPFGEVTRETGPMAKANPIRFSTKYQDDETGLCYYGYRYYDLSSGRWLSRDPSEEDRGYNLYAMCGNEVTGFVDYLGLWIIERDPNKPRALAKAQFGDTFDGLAAIVKLDVSDIDKWLQQGEGANAQSIKPGGFPLLCTNYTVPNIVYVDIGYRIQPPDKNDSFFTRVGVWADTIWDHSPLAFNSNDAGLTAMIAVLPLKAMKYKVDFNPNATGTAIRKQLEGDDIAGLIYAGHGANGLIDTPIDDALYPSRYTQYGITYMWLLACQTAMGAEEWRRNVATSGTFVGYNVKENIYNENSAKVRLSGTNK